MSDDPFCASNLTSLLESLSVLRKALLSAEQDAASEIEAVHGALRESARNLVHYVALRQLDLRPLQARLSGLGLSSLGRSEAHVLSTLDSVMRVLGRMLQAPMDHAARHALRPPSALADQTEALLGKGPVPLIMVTMPSEAAHSYGLVYDLLVAGMNVMRVNCAHDDESAYRQMVMHLERACVEAGRDCKVLFDLPGPKLRTLEVEPGPRVLHIAPKRDPFGRVTAPARVYLTDDPRLHPTEADATLQVPSEWLHALAAGDSITLHDAADRVRTMQVVEAQAHGFWGELQQSTYFTPQTTLTITRGEQSIATMPMNIGATASGIRLRVGDELQLTSSPLLGRNAERDADDRIVRPAHIACAVAEVPGKLRVGDPVWFDDGKIGGIVEQVRDGDAFLRVQHAKPGGSVLRADRGINLPLTPLDLPTLSAEDLAALDCAVDVADLVGLSFARSINDVKALHKALDQRGASHLGIVLKIETQSGFEALPDMLLEALKRPPVGVMIARGDLAVECGFERLAELQEEILWICEAAHVPCIWATQVLESLTKKGAATRAEITDAAMAERAECVMLNKGPHVVRAVAVLGDILSRMRDHQLKKTSMLRPLHSIRLGSLRPEQGVPPERAEPPR